MLHSDSKRLVFSPTFSLVILCLRTMSLEPGAEVGLSSAAFHLRFFLRLSSFYCSHLHTAINLDICALRFYRRRI